MSDLIRREDAIDAIECVTWYHQNRNKDMVSGANSDEHQAWYKAEDIYDALKAIPSADRPQGEWIEHKERTIVMDGNFIDFFPTEYECSNCGLRRATYFINSPLSNYCPNCGCRMKGADDETD